MSIGMKPASFLQGELPKGWSREALADCCSRITDGTHLPPKFTDEGVPFIFVQHIVGGRIRFEKTKFISAETYAELNGRCPVEKGDILYSAVGSYGVAVRVATEAPFSFQRHIAHIKPLAVVSSEFLEYCLNSPELLAQAHKLARGVAQKTVTLGDLKRFTIPIAPLKEQRRIVQKIEELFSKLDAGVEALERVKANLKRYRAAVLKAAVEGKLTAEWRAQHSDIEPASKLLERILKERRRKWEDAQLAKYAAAGKEPPKGWQEKYEEPDGPRHQVHPTLPSTWRWATVEQVSVFAKYGSSAKTGADPSGVPVLRMGNIQDGGIDVSELKYLPRDHSEFPDLLLRRGDLLFNRTNSAELVGKSAVYVGTPDPCSYASYLIGVRIVEGCDPRFLCFYLNSVHGRTWIGSVVSQQVGQANVNGTKLQALAFPLPPVIEQSEIVAEVERRLSIVDELEAQVAADLKRAGRLRQSILKRAFAGRLVPQDPSDEPAAKLLERIGASKSVHEAIAKSTTSARTGGRRAKSKEAVERGNE
jgi:type I restriction enzyme S subunit